ncbi:hypothetical protein CJ030_MR7G011631 [Morella rubra]|uniref:Uncharacterized protein n=1 Tax=Morella rubra TaxID=262757 RepID=A0A6A1V808_9ROSI|nr:hypothetical protein CJ030_MR7G011631 [Morella rubra]
MSLRSMAELDQNPKGSKLVAVAGGCGGSKLVAVAQWLARENQKLVAGAVVPWWAIGHEQQLKAERVTERERERERFYPFFKTG